MKICFYFFFFLKRTSRDLIILPPPPSFFHFCRFFETKISLKMKKGGGDGSMTGSRENTNIFSFSQKFNLGVSVLLYFDGFLLFL